MRGGGAALALWSFWRARRRAAILSDRDRIASYQTRRLRAHLASIATAYPLYGAFRDRPLGAWPMTDKAFVNGRFSELNAAGLDYPTALAIARAGGRTDAGLTIGHSSGTSGNPGVFVVSDTERFIWLGTILARTLGAFPLRRHRVAMLHAAASGLYDAASQSGILQFRFFNTSQGLAGHMSALRDFAPTILIGSPHVLRLLAERNLRLAPDFVFAGGEVLDPLDSTIIAAAMGVRPRSLYQATEGFLGVACAHGVVHLNEDVLHFELEPVAGVGSGVTPIITDFRRKAQAMIRYRLNDVLTLTDAPCACGCAFRGVLRIDGRVDDLLLLPDRRSGRLVKVLPDPVRNAVLNADRSLMDFRLRQTGPCQLEIALPAGTGALARHAIAAALARWADIHHLAAPDLVFVDGLPLDLSRKLRRIRRDWTPAP